MLRAIRRCRLLVGIWVSDYIWDISEIIRGNEEFEFAFYFLFVISGLPELRQELV